MDLYLIERGAEKYKSKAPRHSVIICTTRHTAEWEAGGSPDGATVWSQSDLRKDSKHLHTWFLNRWKGLNCCTFLGTAVYFDLPDGSNTRQHSERAHALVAGAVWWSEKPLPTCAMPTCAVPTCAMPTMVTSKSKLRWLAYQTCLEWLELNR